MKNNRYHVKLAAVFLCMVLLVNFMPLPASAATTEAQIQAAIDNYYAIVSKVGTPHWNAGHSKKVLMENADAGNYDYDVTPNECLYKGGHSPKKGTCDSNSFGGNTQCFGFALYMCYVIFGNYPTRAGGQCLMAGNDYNWTYFQGKTFPVLQAGDMLRYWYYVDNKTTGKKDLKAHAYFIYSNTNGKIKVIDCNQSSIPDGKCIIQIRTLTTAKINSIKGYWSDGHAYVCRNNSMITDDDTPEPPTAPKINVYTDAVTELTETGARLNGHFTASENVHITEHGAYLGISPDYMVKAATDYVDYNKSKLTMFYTTSKYCDDLTPGTTYYYQQYMVIGDDEYKGDILSFTTLGTAPGGRTDTDSGSIGNDDLSYGVVHGTAGNLSIRSGPGTSYEKLGRIPEGATCAVDLSWTSGSWYWVTYNGVSGYASKNYITVSQPQDENIRRGVIHGTAGNLSIRSGPGTSYEKLGRIPEGATCTVDLSGTSGSWYWVTYNGISGYASGKYIELQG